MLHIGMLPEMSVWMHMDSTAVSVQMLDTVWVFDFKINSVTRMIDSFKAWVVVIEQFHILGFVCFDFDVSVPMPEIKLLHALCASESLELHQMGTTSAFIFVSLKLDEVIYCSPSRDMDLDIGPNGLLCE